MFPENWKALQVFLALATQWRMVGVSTMTTVRLIQTGIDYAAIVPVLRLLRVKPARHAALFRKLQAMEQAVLDVVHAS